MDAAAEEATAGAQDGLDVFVATSRKCARSLKKFGAKGWPLEMSAGDGKETMASSLLQWSGMRGECLKGSGGSCGCMKVTGLANCAFVRAAREDCGWKLRLWNGFLPFAKNGRHLQMGSSMPISSSKQQRRGSESL